MKEASKAAIRAIVRVLIESYAKSQARGFEIFGPISGNQLSGEQKSELLLFRERALSPKSTHLLSPFQVELEERLKIDERSFHFFATKNGRMRAAIRLTPRPFEIEGLLENNPDVKLQICERAVEFNRLQVEMGPDSKGLGRALMLLSGCRAYYDLKLENFYAICRGKTVEKFFKFGFELQSNGSFSIPSRPGSDYALITGNATRVAESLLQNISLIIPGWETIKKTLDLGTATVHKHLGSRKI